MTKFLLIGPSGVGKSTALKKLSADNSVDIFDLDELVKGNVGAASVSKYFSDFGNRNFFNKSVDAIENLQIKKTSLIAVGAGSIDYVDGHKWYQNQNTIVLTGNPDTIYNRSHRQKFHPTLDGYKALEFSQHRQSLYSNSKYSVDVTNLNPDQVADKIRDIIKNCS